MELYVAEIARRARSSNARARGMFRQRSGMAGRCGVSGREAVRRPRGAWRGSSGLSARVT